VTREISEPGGHASTSASPPSNVSYAVAHSSVARHAGDGEPVCDGETVAVPVRVAVRDAVPERLRLSDPVAVRDADAPRECVSVIGGEREGVFVADGTMHSSSAHRYSERLAQELMEPGAPYAAAATGTSHDVAPRGHAALTTARLAG